MAKQELVFYVELGDTDDRESEDAIQPLENAERVTAEVLNRPPENLRHRTEVVRTVLEGNNYRHDGLPHIIYCGDATGAGASPTIPEITWDPGVGKFTVSGDLVIMPLVNVAADTQESVEYSFDDGVNTCTVTVATTARAYELANIKRVIWQEAAPGTIPNTKCSLAVSGSPVNTLTITIANDGSCQQGDLETLAIAQAALLTSAQLEMSFAGTSICELNLADIPVDDQDYVFSKTYDKEVHHIPASTFVDFFAASPSPEHTLEDGDTLALAYVDGLVAESGNTGRRQSIPSNANTSKLHGQLFITSDEPNKIPYCVPICRRVGDMLFFIDGSVIYTSETVTGVVSQALGESLEVYLRLAMTTAGNSGADKVGVSAYTDPDPLTTPNTVGLSNATLQDTLEALVREINERVSLNGDTFPAGNTFFMSGILSFMSGSICNLVGGQVNEQYTQAQSVGAFGGDTDYVVGEKNQSLAAVHVGYGAGLVTFTPGPRVLQGLRVLPFNYDGTTKYPVGGKLVVTPGVAIINGKTVYVQRKTVINDIWTDLYTTETKAIINALPVPQYFTGYMYLYLRSDGLLRASLTPPRFLSAAYAQEIWSDENHLYGPGYVSLLADFPESGFTLEDYAFCDVFWHVQGADVLGADAQDIARATGFHKIGKDFYAWPTCEYVDSTGTDGLYFTHLHLVESMTAVAVDALNGTQQLIPLRGRLHEASVPGTPGGFLSFGTAPAIGSSYFSRRRISCFVNFSSTLNPATYDVNFSIGARLSASATAPEAVGAVHPQATPDDLWSTVSPYMYGSKLTVEHMLHLNERQTEAVFTLDVVPGRFGDLSNGVDEADDVIFASYSGRHGVSPNLSQLTGPALFWSYSSGDVFSGATGSFQLTVFDLGFYFDRDAVDNPIGYFGETPP